MIFPTWTEFKTSTFFSKVLNSLKKKQNEVELDISKKREVVLQVFVSFVVLLKITRLERKKKKSNTSCCTRHFQSSFLQNKHTARNQQETSLFIHLKKIRTTTVPFFSVLSSQDCPKITVSGFFFLLTFVTGRPSSGRICVFCNQV